MHFAKFQLLLELESHQEQIEFLFAFGELLLHALELLKGVFEDSVILGCLQCALEFPTPPFQPGKWLVLLLNDIRDELLPIQVVLIVLPQLLGNIHASHWLQALAVGQACEGRSLSSKCRVLVNILQHRVIVLHIAEGTSRRVSRFIGDLLIQLPLPARVIHLHVRLPFTFYLLHRLNVRVLPKEFRDLVVGLDHPLLDLVYCLEDPGFELAVLRGNFDK